MARKPSESDTGRNSKLDDQSLFFDEQRFVDGVFNDDYVLVVGNGVILDVNQKTFKDTGGDINQYILDEINKDRRKTRYGFVDHENFTEVFRGTPPAEPDPIYKLLTDDFSYDLSDISYRTWIESLEFYSVKDDVVNILIPSDQASALDYISKKIHKFL